MSEIFSAERLLLNVATWAAETTSPNAGAGTPAAIGSWWQRQGAYPGAPTEIYLKGQAQDTGWLKQNVVNLNVFNIKDPAFGAVGDGVTDDTAAIQAATDAAQAAGGGVVYFPPVNVGAGQFYRLKAINTGLITQYSIKLDNYHNITFLGDGFASSVALFDDYSPAGISWRGFLAINGSSNIIFDNLQISGAGATGAAPTLALVSALGLTTDVQAGPSHIDAVGVYWGDIGGTASVRARLELQGLDAAHQVTYGSMRLCAGTGSCTNGMFASTSASFQNRISAQHNSFIGCTAIGVAFSTAPANVGDSFDVIGNICDGSLSNNVCLSAAKRGCTAWNICLATGISGAQAVAGQNASRNSLVRGNIVSCTLNAVAGRCISVAPAGIDFEVVGNVCVQTGNLTNTPILASACQGLTVSDNIAVLDAATNLIGIDVQSSQQCVVAGNTVVFTSNPVGTGAGVRCTASTTIPIADTAIIGNLTVGANTLSFGIETTTSGALDLHNAVMSCNLIVKSVIAVEWNRSTGLYLDWRATEWNNCPGCTSSIILLPNNAVGVTQEGPAGPGAQVAIVGTTPLANVSAPQGSLCADTAGGQATAIWYKETGAGVSGGTADWFGIGGYDLVFGALNLSTTLTALFLAPGSDGLATPLATEIQAAVTRPATVRNLRSKVAAAGTGAGTVIHTVRKNGVDTALTVTVTNTSITAVADTTHSFTVVAGDLLSVKITKTATITTAQTNCADTIEIV